LGFLHNQLYPGFAFENVKIHLDTPEQAYGEYQINARSAISGKEIHQQFFGHLIARDGRICKLTEALNVIAAAEAIYPRGMAELMNRDVAK
jgi:hypothetical protein